MGRPSSVDRLVRLLAPPAWVAEHPGASFDEAAAHFGVGAPQGRGRLGVGVEQADEHAQCQQQGDGLPCHAQLVVGQLPGRHLRGPASDAG